MEVAVRACLPDAELDELRTGPLGVGDGLIGCRNRVIETCQDWIETRALSCGAAAVRSRPQRTGTGWHRLFRAVGGVRSSRRSGRQAPLDRSEICDKAVQIGRDLAKLPSDDPQLVTPRRGRRSAGDDGTLLIIARREDRGAPVRGVGSRLARDDGPVELLTGSFGKLDGRRNAHETEPP